MSVSSFMGYLKGKSSLMLYEQFGDLKFKYRNIMGQKLFGMHESSHLNMSFKCSGAFNIIYIMRIKIAEGEKQPPSVNQSYNQRPALADAMSIPIVKSGT